MFDKELSFEWQEQTYSVLVTMDLLDKIDEEFNIVNAVATLTTGDVKFTKVSRFVSFAIGLAGGDIATEEVYQQIFGKQEKNLSAALILCNKVLASCFPDLEEDEGEKKSD